MSYTFRHSMDDWPCFMCSWLMFKVFFCLFGWLIGGNCIAIYNFITNHPIIFNAYLCSAPHPSIWHICSSLMLPDQMFGEFFPQKWQFQQHQSKSSEKHLNFSGVTFLNFFVMRSEVNTAAISAKCVESQIVVCKAVFISNNSLLDQNPKRKK